MQITSGGVDVSLVRGFLQELRAGRVYIARVTKGGPGRKYSYLFPPLRLLEALGLHPGDRLHVVIGNGYIDYVVDKRGQYRLSKVGRNAMQLRFPIDSVEGYVIVEPLPDGRGFRVYY